MPETVEELIALVKSGTIIKCDTVEQCREALRFFKEEGEQLGYVTGEWYDSHSRSFDGYQHVGFSQGCISRYGYGALERMPYVEFDSITPILRGEAKQGYEIDESVFDALFS